MYRTGVRVSELVARNRQGIDFDNMRVVAYGKGEKEREIFLTASACMYLKEWLDFRTDSNKALFVSRKVPHKRLNVSRVEEILRRLRKSTNIPKVYPPPQSVCKYYSCGGRRN